MAVRVMRLGMVTTLVAVVMIVWRSPADADELTVCRAPQFWAMHAETDTQPVLDASAGDVNVCGAILANTLPDSARSALEALCVSRADDPRLELVRQLAALSLNCVATSGDARCTGLEHGGSAVGALFESCTSVCLNGADSSIVADCIVSLGCVNQGGYPEGGSCYAGRCSASGAPCRQHGDCPAGDEDLCLPIACQRATDVDGEAPSSLQACGEASASPCAVIARGEAFCAER